MSGPPRLQLSPRRLAGTYEVTLNVFRDDRGSLARVFDVDAFATLGIPLNWMQHVVQETRYRNTVRGLHLQVAPATESKLIIPLSGRIFWAFVDVRRGSPTFGRWDAVEIDAEAGRGVFVPRGFAHGGLSLTDGVSLSILADNRYIPAHGIGIRWDDPDIGIEWPRLGTPPRISEEHGDYPGFRDFVSRVGGI
jgi:dTDP-4-dehydrorhamnose 3,5-epimerase